MSYDVTFGRQAKKDIKTLDATIISRIAERLSQLCENPFDGRISKPIRMAPGRRTSRVGDWRIIYEIHESERLIDVVSIRARKEAY